MPRRLSADERRQHLIDAGAAQFASQPYDDVRMDDVARRSGVSRALLYRHFPSKRELFAAVYQQAADQLLEQTPLEPDKPMDEQIRAGLDAHIDYFEQNRQAVLSANRTLAGDPVIQAIIEGELDALRERMLDAAGFDDERRQVLSSVLMSWLVFVRVLTVEWLDRKHFSRTELREISVSALNGALASMIDLDGYPAG